MYRILTKIKYEYAHRLIHHQGKCRHVHGHSGEATIDLMAKELNDSGFVMDFGDVKAPLKAWIDQHWDHAYLSNAADPLLPIIRAQGLKTFSFPCEPSAEVMAKHLYDHVVAELELRPEITVNSVTVQETCTGLAVYEPGKVERQG